MKQETTPLITQENNELQTRIDNLRQLINEDFFSGIKKTSDQVQTDRINKKEIDIKHKVTSFLEIVKEFVNEPQLSADEIAPHYNLALNAVNLVSSMLETPNRAKGYQIQNTFTNLIDDLPAEFKQVKIGKAMLGILAAILGIVTAVVNTVLLPFFWLSTSIFNKDNADNGYKEKPRHVYSATEWCFKTAHTMFSPPHTPVLDTLESLRSSVETLANLYEEKRYVPFQLT